MASDSQDNPLEGGDRSPAYEQLVYERLGQHLQTLQSVVSEAKRINEGLGIVPIRKSGALSEDINSRLCVELSNPGETSSRERVCEYLDQRFRDLQSEVRETVRDIESLGVRPNELPGLGLSGHPRASPNVGGSSPNQDNNGEENVVDATSSGLAPQQYNHGCEDQLGSEIEYKIDSQPRRHSTEGTSQDISATISEFSASFSQATTAVTGSSATQVESTAHEYVRQVAAALTQDPATVKVIHDALVKNREVSLSRLARILRKYARELQAAAGNDIERIISNFVRREYNGIAQSIEDLVLQKPDAEDEKTLVQLEELLRSRKEPKPEEKVRNWIRAADKTNAESEVGELTQGSQVEDRKELKPEEGVRGWMGAADEANAKIEGAEPPQENQAEGQNSSEDGGSERDDEDQDLNDNGRVEQTGFPSITAARGFLQAGEPFQNLIKHILERLELKVKPVKLPDNLSAVVPTGERPGPNDSVPAADVVTGDHKACPGDTLIAVDDRSTPREKYNKSPFLTRLGLWLHTAMRPPVRPGHQRITWVCGCGEAMYADINEVRPGAAHRLEEALRQSAAVVMSRPNRSEQAVPPRAYLPPVNHDRMTQASQQISNFHSLTSNSITLGDVGGCASGVADQDEDSTPQYLLLCVNKKSLTALEQIEVSPLGTDEHLFRDIRHNYECIRKAQAWNLSMTMPNWIRMPTWLTKYIEDILTFSVPKSANFFHLAPIKTEICPINFKYPSLPPEKEVKHKKTYHYDPCPTDIEDPLLHNQFIHQLLKPGEHLDRYWIQTFPKKLRQRLEYDSIRRENGWGIHIIEGPNLFAFTFVAFLIVVVSGVLSVTYSLLRKDVSSGFAMGSFIASVLTLGLALQYFRWEQF